MSNTTVGQPGAGDASHSPVALPNDKGKGLNRNILIKTSKGGQDFSVKKIETSFDKFVSTITFSSPKYATAKEADAILKNYTQGTVPKDKKVVDIACRIVLASLQEQKGSHKIGLDDLKMYSPDLREKILRMSGEHSHASHMLSASELLSHIDLSGATNTVATLKEQLLKEKPSITVLKELSVNLKGLQTKNQVSDVILEIDYEIFKLQMQEAAPEKEAFKDGHKIGLNDLLSCSQAVQEKIFAMKGENVYVAHLDAANGLVEHARSSPNDASALQDLKKQLVNANPPATLLKELNVKLRELQLTNPDSQSIKDIIHSLDYEIFKAQIQELEPGSAEFKQVFRDMPKEQLREFFPKFVREVFIQNKQYRGSDGEDFYNKLIRVSSHQKALGNMERSDKDYRVYQESVLALTEIFPETKKYIKNDLVFTVTAMKELLATIKAKEGSPFANVSCGAGRRHEFEETLKQIDMQKDQQLAFIFNYSDLPNHMAPIHIRVKDGKMSVVVTESLSGNTKLSDELKRVFDNSDHKANVSVLFVFTDRQKDGTNCPTLSLADAKEFATHPELFDEMESLSAHIDRTRTNYGVNFKSIYPDVGGKIELPVRLLRYNQSVTVIKNKLKEVEAELESLRKNNGSQDKIDVLEADVKLLNQTIEKHVRKGVLIESTSEDTSEDDPTDLTLTSTDIEKKEKDFNVFAMQRYRKHEALLVSALLEQSLIGATK